MESADISSTKVDFTIDIFGHDESAQTQVWRAERRRLRPPTVADWAQRLNIEADEKTSQWLQTFGWAMGGMSNQFNAKEAALALSLLRQLNNQAIEHLREWVRQCEKSKTHISDQPHGRIVLQILAEREAMEIKNGAESHPNSLPSRGAQRI